MVSQGVIDRARRIWDEREKGFPKFTRQTWDQGTEAARMATLARAWREMQNVG